MELGPWYVERRKIKLLKYIGCNYSNSVQNMCNIVRLVCAENGLKIVLLFIVNKLTSVHDTHPLLHRINIIDSSIYLITIIISTQKNLII